MQQTQNLPYDLIQIHPTPCPVSFAHKMMDPVNDISSSTRICRDISEQLLEHLEVERTLRQQPPRQLLVRPKVKNRATVVAHPRLLQREINGPECQIR